MALVLGTSPSLVSFRARARGFELVWGEPLDAGDRSARRPRTGVSDAPREAGTGKTAALHPQRVLVAEDDEGFRSALALCLRTAGYHVTEAHDGRELLDALNATPAGYFDLVIADHRMPLVSGLECLAQAGARARFVIVSGVEGDSIRTSATRFGAAAVVQKPVDLEALLALIRDLLPSR